MNLKKGKIYLCEWKDCITDSTWTNRDEIDAVLEKKTKLTFDVIGRFICEKNGYYCFETGMCSDGDLFNYILMPKEMIIRARELK